MAAAAAAAAMVVFLPTLFDYKGTFIMLLIRLERGNGLSSSSSSAQGEEVVVVVGSFVADFVGWEGPFHLFCAREREREKSRKLNCSPAAC